MQCGSGRANYTMGQPRGCRQHLEAVANYMLKGSADEVAAELGLGLRKRGGEVIGKRAGRTQNIRFSGGHRLN